MRGKFVSLFALFLAVLLFIYVLQCGYVTIIDDVEMSEQPQFSYHQCIQEDNLLRRSCLFYNLCYDRNTSTFVYHQQQPPMRRYISGKHESFIPLLKLSTEDDHNDFMLAHIRKHAIPNDVIWLEAESAVLHAPVYPDNFGHRIDSVFSAYNLRMRFKHEIDDFQVIIPFGRDCRTQLNEANSNSETICTKYETLFEVISSFPILSISTDPPFAYNNVDAPLVCMKKLIAGEGSLGMNRDDAGHFNHFIRSLINHYSVTLPPTIKHHSIGIVNKGEGRRQVTNFPELQAYLESTFVVEVTIINNIHMMSIPEQIDLMRRFSVVISPCGGISFSTLFKAPGTSAVYIGYWSPTKNKPEQMEQYIWTSQADVSDFYYPVYRNESFVRNPPAASTEFQKFRNYADVQVNFPRMRQIVQHAMYSTERRLGW